MFVDVFVNVIAAEVVIVGLLVNVIAAEVVPHKQRNNQKQRFYKPVKQNKQHISDK